MPAIMALAAMFRLISRRRPQDRGLETPYINHRPELRGNLKSQFNYLPPSKSYSLRQTLLDLKIAAYHSAPNFVGNPAGSPLLEILQKNFVNLYSKAATSYGQPILAVAAVAEDNPDPSTLQVTSVGHQSVQGFQCFGRQQSDP